VNFVNGFFTHILVNFLHEKKKKKKKKKIYTRRSKAHIGI